MWSGCRLSKKMNRWYQVHLNARKDSNVVLYGSFFGHLKQYEYLYLLLKRRGLMYLLLDVLLEKLGQRNWQIARKHIKGFDKKIEGWTVPALLTNYKSNEIRFRCNNQIFAASSCRSYPERISFPRFHIAVAEVYLCRWVPTLPRTLPPEVENGMSVFPEKL